jgi:hypothetical protein
VSVSLIQAVYRFQDATLVAEKKDGNALQNLYRELESTCSEDEDWDLELEQMVLFPSSRLRLRARLRPGFRVLSLTPGSLALPWRWALSLAPRTLASPLRRGRRGLTSWRLSQPHLDPTILLAAVLIIIGSDWQVLPVSVHKRWCYASHLQLFGDGLRAVF